MCVYLKVVGRTPGGGRAERTAEGVPADLAPALTVPAAPGDPVAAEAAGPLIPASRPQQPQGSQGTRASVMQDLCPPTPHPRSSSCSNTHNSGPPA